MRGDGWRTAKEVLTLRDYFAAAALSNGRLTNQAQWREIDQKEPGPPDELAAYCYDIADAMLEAREK